MKNKKSSLGVIMALAAGLLGFSDDASAQRANGNGNSAAPTCCTTFNRVSPPGGPTIQHHENSGTGVLINAAIGAGVVFGFMVAKAVYDNAGPQPVYEDPRNNKKCGYNEIIVRGSKKDIDAWREDFQKTGFDSDILRFVGLETSEKTNIQFRNGWEHFVEVPGTGQTKLEIGSTTRTQRLDLLGVNVLDALADPDTATRQYHTCHEQARYGYFKIKTPDGKSIVNPRTLPSKIKINPQTANAMASIQPAAEKTKVATRNPNDPWSGMR